MLPKMPFTLRFPFEPEAAQRGMAWEGVSAEWRSFGSTLWPCGYAGCRPGLGLLQDTAQHEIQDCYTTAQCIVQLCSETYHWKQPCAATGFHLKCFEVNGKILSITVGFGWSQRKGNRTDTYHKQGGCFSFLPLIDFVIHLWILTTFFCMRLS